MDSAAPSSLSVRLRLILHWTQVGIRTGLIEMRAHPLRCILSALGVMIGIAVMVTMLSLSGGVEKMLNERIGKWMGSVNIWSQREDPSPEERRAFSRSPGMKFSDGAYIEKTVTGVARQYRMIQSEAPIISAARIDHAHIRGVDSATLAKEFDMDQPMEIKEGENLSEEDFLKGTDVCVISTVLADQIRKGASMPDTQSVLGYGIGIQNRRYRVKGLFNTVRPNPNPNPDHWWRRYNIYIPLLSAQENLAGFDPDPGYLWLEVEDPKRMDVLLPKIIAAMLARHRGVQDFEYQKPDFLDTFINMIENINLMFLIVAMVALIAGGLGIMNVMLSSVSERVREIGVRKALGAGELQIFVQFVAESSTLCFIGGVFGAALGSLPLVFSEAIEAASGLTPTVSPGAGLAVFLIVVFMGVAFGTYPALKASKMNPIDALRYE